MNRFLIATLCAVSVALGSCSSRGPSTPVPQIPQRIISVVPSATEMLFAFGLADRIIAVGDYDELPPQYAGKPRIGGLLNPNIEKIIEYKPDLVITYGSQEILRDRMKELGIRIYPFTHGSIDQTLEYMVALGRTVGAEDKAHEIEQRIRMTFDEIRKHAPTNHPKVLLAHDRSIGSLGSFYSVGKTAFQNELIEIAGGENIFADVDKEVMQPSIEAILQRGPEIIIETLPSGLSAQEAERRKSDWNKLAKLPAVVNKRVFIIGEDYMLVPGPRLDLAARKFAEVIGSTPN
ncbi:MAG TPA: helical backbone metal receptor [Terriglobia bacterium]|nr:helical backbone metal receptor [Terriglobia bacterium]